MGNRANAANCLLPRLFPSEAVEIRQGVYRYTDDLLHLEAIAQGKTDVAQSPQSVVGFLPLHAWTPFLASHPDQCYAAFLERGIRNGFRVGFNPSCPLRSAQSNLPSALRQDQVIDH